MWRTGKVVRNMRMNAACFHWDRDFVKFLENISCSHLALRPYYSAMQSATAVRNTITVGSSSYCTLVVDFIISFSFFVSSSCFGCCCCCLVV